MTLKHKLGGKSLLPKSTSKSLSQKNLSLSPTMDSPSLSGLDQEAENKFELELYWCIQQLELSVRSGKLTEKSMRVTKGNLDLLKNDNVTLVQKRQIMRITFGDYREKMVQEEKKHGKTASLVKLLTPKLNDSKSLFIRKAQIAVNIHPSLINELNDQTESNRPPTRQLSSLFRKSVSSQPFIFNFNQLDT